MVDQAATKEEVSQGKFVNYQQTTTGVDTYTSEPEGDDSGETNKDIRKNGPTIQAKDSDT